MLQESCGAGSEMTQQKAQSTKEMNVIQVYMYCSIHFLCVMFQEVSVITASAMLEDS